MFTIEPGRKLRSGGPLGSIGRAAAARGAGFGADSATPWAAPLRPSAASKNARWAAVRGFASGRATGDDGLEAGASAMRQLAPTYG